MISNDLSEFILKFLFELPLVLFEVKSLKFVGVESFEIALFYVLEILLNLLLLLFLFVQDLFLIICIGLALRSFLHP